jgi:glycosyltransferase involved in cell wall biosynthesis
VRRAGEVDVSTTVVHTVSPESERATPGFGGTLVIAPQPFYQDRGTPIALRHVLEALSELGHSVDILTYPLGRDIDLPRMRYHRLPNPLRFRSIPIGFSLKKLVLDFVLAFHMKRLMREHRYAFVYAVEEAAFIAAILCPDDVVLIYDMQSSIPEQLGGRRGFRSGPLRAALRLVERTTLRRAHYVAASAGLSKHAQSVSPTVLVSEWRFPDQVAMVPPCSDRLLADALRGELAVPDDARLVVYGGNFSDGQGVPILLQSSARVVDAIPQAVFVLAGAVDDKEVLATESSLPPAIRDNVRVLIRQPRDKVRRLFEIADLLISPRTRGSNAPIKIFDYMASGRPIVATDIAAHRAILSDTRALLVEPTAEALAEGILHLMANPDCGERLAAAALQDASGPNAKGQFVCQVDQIFALGLAEHRRRHGLSCKSR